jgi:hypothetical protein
MRTFGLYSSIPQPGATMSSGGLPRSVLEKERLSGGRGMKTVNVDHSSR